MRMRLLPFVVGVLDSVRYPLYIYRRWQIIHRLDMCHPDNTIYDMKKVKLGKHLCEIYDAIDELPMARFHKYNKYLLIDAGIGSDLSDIDRHIERAAMFIRNGNNDHAATELANLRQNVFFVMSGLSPRCLAFCVLVKSMDGEECSDLSDEGIKTVYERLNDVTVREISENLDAIRTKIDSELQQYFPSLFDDADMKEYFDLLRERTKMVLKDIINGTDSKEAIERATLNLLLHNKPKSFSGNDNAEIAYDKQYERMCLSLSQSLNVNPKLYTTLEYYNAYEYLVEMTRKAERTHKKRA